MLTPDPECAAFPPVLPPFNVSPGYYPKLFYPKIGKIAESFIPDFTTAYYIKVRWAAAGCPGSAAKIKTLNKIVHSACAYYIKVTTPCGLCAWRRRLLRFADVAALLAMCAVSLSIHHSSAELQGRDRRRHLPLLPRAIPGGVQQGTCMCS